MPNGKMIEMLCTQNISLTSHFKRPLTNPGATVPNPSSSSFSPRPITRLTFLHAAHGEAGDQINGIRPAYKRRDRTSSSGTEETPPPSSILIRTQAEA